MIYYISHALFINTIYAITTTQIVSTIIKTYTIIHEQHHCHHRPTPSSSPSIIGYVVIDDFNRLCERKAAQLIFRNLSGNSLFEPIRVITRSYRYVHIHDMRVK